MRAGGFPGNPGGLVVSIVKTAGALAPAHHARGRGRRTWRPTERTAGARMVPPGEGNEVRGDGRRGIGVSHSTAKAGELSPRDPVEGRGHRQVAPLEGTTANTPRLGSVSTLRQRIAALARQAFGMAMAIAWSPWTSGYATARSEAICRGAGCGRTRTSGSVGGPGSATTLVYPTCARHGAQRPVWRCQPEGESRPGSDWRVQVPWRP